MRRGKRRTDEASSSEERDDQEDAFDGSGEGREEERSRVEFLPRRKVEVGRCCGQRGDGPPVEAEIESGGRQDHTEL